MTHTAELVDWTSLAGHEWDGLLLGNGASCAVWEPFGYHSLFDIATDASQGWALSAEACRLFDAFGTRNFERILAALTTALTVNEVVLGLDDGDLRDVYNSVQEALIAAVHQVHVPWLDAEASLPALNTALAAYDSIFSLNYDLLMYWAVMHDKSHFKDMLWGDSFDPMNVEVGGKFTKVHWLHGGLHLYRTTAGRTIKRKAQPGANLLDVFEDDWDEMTPLFVSEGSSDDKLRSIHASDYLSFAFRALANHRHDLVIFGASLGDPDEHVVRAIRGNRRRLAISIRPSGDADDVVAKKAGFERMFPNFQLDFFDAASHPLGIPELGVAHLEQPAT